MNVRQWFLVKAPSKWAAALNEAEAAAYIGFDPFLQSRWEDA